MRIIILLLFSVLVPPAQAKEPYIDPHQLKAIEACYKDRHARGKVDSDCDSGINIEEVWGNYPIVYRASKRYCKEVYGAMGVDELKAALVELDRIDEIAREIPPSYLLGGGVLIDKERGELTKGMILTEWFCANSYLKFLTQ